MTLPDDDLHRAFQDARAAERHDAPPFVRVRAGRTPRRRGRLGWVLAGAVAAGAVAIALAVRRDGGTARELELARQVSTWRSPTEFLLQMSRADLLAAPPRLGEAPAGSPLKALDPGGPLGPSIPEGSHRL